MKYVVRTRTIPLINDTSIRSIKTTVREMNPDCVVISSYNRIIPPELLALSRFINVHYSLLPRYRGRANVNWALLNGERCTGISIHVIDPGLDSGNILFQEPLPIDDDATVTDLYDKLNRIQREHLGKTVKRFLDGYGGRPQAAEEATYCCTRIPSDGEIEWADTTSQIYRLVRALQPPFPYAYTFLNGRPIQICRARPVSNAARFVGRIPGRIVAVDKTTGGVDVLTGDGVLRITEVQSAAERVTAANVITSTKQSLGLRTSDLLRRIDELESQLNRTLAGEKQGS